MSDLQSLAQESIINSRIEFQNQALQHLINFIISDQLDSGFSLSEDDLNIAAALTNPLQLDVEHEDVFIKLPLDVSISKKGTFTGFKLNARVVVHMRIRYSISPKWDLKCDTEVEKLFWDKYPSLRKGGINMPLKWLVSSLEKKLRKLIAIRIDNFINNKIILSNMLKKTLKECKTLLIRFPVAGHYLHPRLSSVYPGEINIQAGSGHVDVGFDLRLKLVDNHDIKINNHEQIRLLSKDSTDNKSRLEWQCAFNGHKICNYLSEILKAHVISIKDKSLVIDDISCELKSETFKIKLSFNGDHKGVILLGAQAELDKLANCIRLNQLSIELSEGNILLKSVFIFLKARIKEEIKTFIESDINQHLVLINDLIGQRIKTMSKDSGTSVKMEITKVILKSFDLKKDQAKLTVLTEFGLSLKLFDAKLFYERFVSSQSVVAR